MKKFNLLLTSCLLATSMFFMAGCSKSGSNSSGGSVADPEGTIIVSIANNGKNMYIDMGNPIDAGYITIGTDNLWMSYDNNFRPDSKLIANVGKVNGLGAINKIPASGNFVKQMAVEPGYGYVILIGQSSYVRLYVVDWVLDTGNGIIGAKVKYQYPFTP